LVARCMSVSDACSALGEAKPAPGRMEVLGRSRQLPWVVIDYAHTPDALRRVLGTLTSLGPRRIVCVFGCGGDRDRGTRRWMGAVAAALADTLVLTDDTPRNEDPADITREIHGGVGDHPDVSVIHDRLAAIRAALCYAEHGSVTLAARAGPE